MKQTEQQTLNILIRTSDRPFYFKRCIDSICHAKGNYKIKVLVSVDNKNSENYSKEILLQSNLDFEIIFVIKGSRDFHYNLYLNKLLDKAEGWVWIIDDDDTVLDMDFKLSDKRVVYIFKSNYFGRSLPEDEYWETITECHIAMHCFIFHTEGLRSEFDNQRRADYRFIKHLSSYRKVEWIDKVVAVVDKKGYGSCNDLPASIDFVVPYAFDKNLGKEYNRIFEQSKADYVCIMDGDILFFQNSFGHFISNVISKNYDGAIFTCVTNRIGNPEQRIDKKISSDANILRHKKIALKRRRKYGYFVTQAHMRTSMLISIISKKVWNEIRFNEGLKGIDWQFTQSVLDKGFPIYIMQGLYVFHLYRLGDGGVYYTKHLDC